MWGQSQGQAHLWSLDVTLEDAKPGRTPRVKGTRTLILQARKQPQKTRGMALATLWAEAEPRLAASAFPPSASSLGQTHRGGGNGRLTPRV